ncbi:Serine decarboxylase 1, partial [Mucuna pruriens]
MWMISQAPRITFKKPIGSVTISGHKFLGSPIPCGVVITRLEYINALSKDVEIIASRDATITGSRCGHAPIFLWYALKIRGLIGLQNEVQKCITNARYLQNRLRDAGIGAMLNEFSNIVIFERPLDDGFTREFLQNRSIWFKDRLFQPLCIANDIGSGNCACSLHNYHDRESKN